MNTKIHAIQTDADLIHSARQLEIIHNALACQTIMVHLQIVIMNVFWALIAQATKLVFETTVSIPVLVRVPSMPDVVFTITYLFVLVSKDTLEMRSPIVIQYHLKVIFRFLS